MNNRDKIIEDIEYGILMARATSTTLIHLPVDKAEEIVELLREQEAKSPVIREKNGYWDYYCPTCGGRDEELFREWNYCPFCGQEVKWE